MKKDTIKWEHPVEAESKGSILLVHGTAPMNIDGNIPACGDEYPLGSLSLYKELSRVLAAGGWRTLRYTRDGVYDDSVNWEEYMKVDHNAIIAQLSRLILEMPAEKPRIVFCWSGGSLHVPHLPLELVDGVVILGGICTGKTHNSLMLQRDSTSWESFLKEVEEFERMGYEDIIKINRPHGDGPLLRLWQEIRLKDNWQYFRRFTDLPLLILHGTDDREVHLTQARLWNQLLPHHRLRVVEKPGRNHFLGNDNETGSEAVGAEVLKWLDDLFLPE